MPRLLDRALDATIALSFDQTGFRRHSASFNAADLAMRLDGQDIVVTGANAGIGRATATALAAMGARVWLVCRNRERGEEARGALAAQGADVRLLVGDVSNLADVRRVAKALPPHVHALVHNAGALLDERQVTAEGLEQTFATHVAGPFLLTVLLARSGRLGGAERSRVVWVASGGMYSRKLDVDALVSPPEPFDGVTAYAQCKRAQVILNELLAVRLPDTWLAAMHPGWADTLGVRTSLPTFRRLTAPLLRTAETGADTVVWLAAAERGATGQFWFDRVAAPTHLWSRTQERPAERARLWETTCAKVGLDPVTLAVVPPE